MLPLITYCTSICEIRSSSSNTCTVAVAAVSFRAPARLAPGPWSCPPARQPACPGPSPVPAPTPASAAAALTQSHTHTDGQAIHCSTHSLHNRQRSHQHHTPLSLSLSVEECDHRDTTTFRTVSLSVCSEPDPLHTCYHGLKVQHLTLESNTNIETQTHPCGGCK